MSEEYTIKGGSGTIDDAVRDLLQNQNHAWATFIAPSPEPNWEYCSRCGRKQDDLRLDDGAFIPCKGFVG